MTRARDVANLIGSGNYSTTTFTATAGQTAFTISHTQGFVQVFMNGLLLDETVDYTSNGTAITLTSGAAAGDEIEVVAYNTFSVGDALNQAAADTRYVNATGDTMTGSLKVGSATSTRALATKSSSVTVGNFESTSTSGGLVSFSDANTTDDVHVRVGAVANNLVLQAGGSERVRVDSSGRVTIPNQPSWCLQPNHSSAQSYTQNIDNQFDMVVAGSNGTFVNGGVTTSNSGRVTVPVAGKYFCYISFRQSNVNTWYELRIKKNGTSMVRGGIWYSSNDYESVNLARVIDASANDYFTAHMSIGSTNSIDGYGDQLTFFSGFLIG